MKDFDLSEWQRMRADGEILLGRFARGKVRFMLKDDAAKYAYFRTDSTVPGDGKYLEMIRASPDGMTMREVVARSGDPKESVREAIMRLDRSVLIQRCFGGREDWGTENLYSVYEPDTGIPDPTDEMVTKAIRAFGPVPVTAMRFLVSVPEGMIDAAARRVGAVQVLVGPGQVPMWIMEDEVPALNSVGMSQEKARIMSPFDPDLGSKWAELSARYGDSFIYPVCKGSRVIGGVELWEMSGCIEIRGFDLDLPEYLDEALDAVDAIMGFFMQKGTDIVRIREVMRVPADQLDREQAGTMRAHGYVFVNGFYAKGVFSEWTMTPEQSLLFVLGRQHLRVSDRYSTVREFVNSRPYIRSEQEMICRVEVSGDLKKFRGKGILVKGFMLPSYTGYSTLSNLAIVRAAKQSAMGQYEREIARIVKDNGPISKKEVQFRSRHTYEETAETLSSLMRRSVICQDGDGYYRCVPVNGMSRDEGLMEVAKWHFADFGIMSAEQTASMLDVRMAEARHILALLEMDDYVGKGFFIEGDPTLYWMPKEDIGKEVKGFKDMFIINTQDNLYLFLKPYIREKAGSMRVPVFEGSEIIGHFKGKLYGGNYEVEDFKGEQRAWSLVTELGRKCGARIRTISVEDDMDWESSEFYSRTNPGIRSQRYRTGVVQQFLGVTGVPSEHLPAVRGHPGITAGDAVAGLHLLPDADVHRECAQMSETEYGDTVGDLGADTVDARKGLHEFVIGHLAHRTDVHGAGFHILAQSDEALFAETQSAFSDAAAAVEDLSRRGECMPVPEIVTEQIADGFRHPGYSLHVHVGSEKVGGEAFPFRLSQYPEARACTLEVGHVRVPSRYLPHYRTQIVLYAEIAFQFGTRDVPAAFETVRSLTKGDGMPPDHPVPFPVRSSAPAVGLTASEGGIEGDIHGDPHAPSMIPDVFIDSIPEPRPRVFDGSAAASGYGHSDRFRT